MTLRVCITLLGAGRFRVESLESVSEATSSAALVETELCNIAISARVEKGGMVDGSDRLEAAVMDVSEELGLGLGSACVPFLRRNRSRLRYGFGDAAFCACGTFAFPLRVSLLRRSLTIVE